MSGVTIEEMPRDARGRVALAPRQRDVLNAIRTLSKRLGYPPTIREIADECGIGNTNGVKIHLDPLRRKGWVTWQDGKARTLKVVGE